MQLSITTYQNREKKVVKTVHGNNTFFSYHTCLEEKMITEREAFQLVTTEKMVLIDTITVKISVTI